MRLGLGIGLGIGLSSKAPPSVYGPELWVGTASVPAGWVANADGSYTATAASNSLTGIGTYTSGRKYRQCIEMISYTAGAVTLPFDGLNLTLTMVSLCNEEIQTEPNPIFIAGSAFTGTIRISVREILPVFGPELFVGILAPPAGWVDNGDGTYTGTATSTALTATASYVIGKRYYNCLEVISLTSGQCSLPYDGAGIIVTAVSLCADQLPANANPFFVAGAVLTGTVRPSVREIL